MTGYTMQQSSAMGFQGLGTDTQGQTLGGAVEGFDAEAYVTSMATAADSTASMAESTASAEHSMQNMKTSGQQLATDMTRVSTTMRSLPQAHTLTVTVRPNTTAMPAWFRDWVNQVVGERPSDQHPGQGGT
jgi:hypothetical protein